MSGIAEVGALEAHHAGLLPFGLLTPFAIPWTGLRHYVQRFQLPQGFFDAATIEGLPAFLKILAAMQTILATILLFLIGLGVCNKFPIK